jgi:hypothetical protein
MLLVSQNTREIQKGGYTRGLCNDRTRSISFAGAPPCCCGGGGGGSGVVEVVVLWRFRIFSTNLFGARLCALICALVKR